MTNAAYDQCCLSNRNSVVMYREQLAKLAVHVEMASKLSAAIDAGHLTDIGALEQALVYGDAGSKELIALLTGPQAPHLLPSDKVGTLLAKTMGIPNALHLLMPR